MNFLKFPLHHQNSGTVVEVTLRGVESDVFLVDDPNLRQLERGGQVRYHGGHYNGSPVRLRVPSSGNWTAVVIPSPGGTVQAAARVISAA
jgi:Domain of unknown function (DUF1883)